MLYQAAIPTFSVLMVLSAFLFLQLLLGNSVYASSSLSPQMTESSLASCISYDPEENMITITCQSSNLSNIHSILGDQNVLLKEDYVDVDVDTISRNIDGDSGNVWQLNAGIAVAQNATL